MIAVDTSVWVAALRDEHSLDAQHLRGLLDQDQVAVPAPVRVEILSGASRRDLPRLKRTLSALPIYYPTATTWRAIDDWIERASRARQRFGFADLLIAALAAEHDAAVWSLDADFVRLGRVRFVTLYAPHAPA